MEEHGMYLELSMMATKRYGHTYEYARVKPRRAILLCHAEATLEFLLFPPVVLVKPSLVPTCSYAPSMPRKRRAIGTIQKQT